MEYIRDRDHNTYYFHLSTIIRRRTNRIEGILNTEGAWVTQLDDLEALITGYYKELFIEAVSYTHLTLPTKRIV